MAPFTPQSRIEAPDPATRVIGHQTKEIVLGDDESYLLEGFGAGTYEVTVEDLYNQYDAFEAWEGDGVARLTYRPLNRMDVRALNTQAADSSDTDNHTANRIASVAYDHTGGTVEQEITFTFDAAHNLRIGQHFTVRLDADVENQTAFAGGSVRALISGGYKVLGVPTPTTVISTYEAGTADDADDPDIDGNCWIHPAPDAEFQKTTPQVSLASSAGVTICSDAWDGEISGSGGVEAGHASLAAGGLNPAGGSANWFAGSNVPALDFGLDTSGAGVITLQNELAGTAENSYAVMRNSPVISRDEDGYGCFFVNESGELELKNRYGGTFTFQIRRVS